MKIKAKELKKGITVNYNKFYVGYCVRDKMYFTGKHMSTQRIIQFDNIKELREWVSFNK